MNVSKISLVVCAALAMSVNAQSIQKPNPGGFSQPQGGVDSRTQPKPSGTTTSPTIRQPNMAPQQPIADPKDGPKKPVVAFTGLPQSIGVRKPLNLQLANIPTDIDEVKVATFTSSCALQNSRDFIRNMDFLEPGRFKLDTRVASMPMVLGGTSSARFSGSRILEDRECSVAVNISGRKRGETAFTPIPGLNATQSRTVDLSTYKRVVVNDTARLSKLLAFETRSRVLGSVCSGTSTGAGQPAREVGQYVEQGDIAFKIRSGPLGTSCDFVTSAVNPGLSNSIIPVRVTFSTKLDGNKCSSSKFTADDAGQASTFGGNRDAVILNRQLNLTQGNPSSGVVNIPRGTGDFNGMLPAILMEGSKSVSWVAAIDQRNISKPVSASATRDPRGGLYWQPLAAYLTCEGTAVNDHGVSLRIDSMEFVVPKDSSFPAGF